MTSTTLSQMSQQTTYEGQHCPVQGGHPRCTPTYLATSECSGGANGQLVVNLGAGNTLAAGNAVVVNGWSARGSITCYFPDGTTQSFGQWSPSGMSTDATYAVPGCAGAQAFVLYGGGFCGGSKLCGPDNSCVDDTIAINSVSHPPSPPVSPPTLPPPVAPSPLPSSPSPEPPPMPAPPLLSVVEEIQSLQAANAALQGLVASLTARIEQLEAQGNTGCAKFSQQGNMCVMSIANTSDTQSFKIIADLYTPV